MSDRLGPMRFGHPPTAVFLGRDFTSTPDYSDEVAATIDSEVRGLIERAHAVAHDVLAVNRAVLDHLATELVAHETLEAERVQELFAAVQLWEGAGESPARATRRPDGTPAAAGQTTAAAATPVDQPHRGAPA